MLSRKKQLFITINEYDIESFKCENCEIRSKSNKYLKSEFSNFFVSQNNFAEHLLL